MGIDLATWRARIGLNYYHACRPFQTRWRSSGGRLHQPGVAGWGGGGGHGSHTPGAQGLHGSRSSVTDTAVHSPHLAQAEREKWWWQVVLLLVWDLFSSEGDSGQWRYPAAQSLCGDDTSTANHGRGRGTKPWTSQDAR